MLAAICRRAAHRRGGRHPRQDHDVVDAGPVLVEAGLQPVVHHRRRRQRDRHRRRAGTTASCFVVEADESDGTFLELAPAASPSSPTWSPTTSTTTAASPPCEAAFERFVGAAGGPSRGGRRRRRRRRARRWRRRPGGRRHLRHHRRRRRTAWSTPRSGRDGARCSRWCADGEDARRAGAAGAGPAQRRATPPRPRSLALELGAPFDAAAARAGPLRRAWPGASSSGARPAASPSSTTTPTCPPRCAPPSAPPARAGWNRVVAVFQPHRYSRTAELWPHVRRRLRRRRRRWRSPTSTPPASRPGPGVTGKLVVNAVLDAHPWRPVAYLPRRDDVVTYLLAELRPGDLCLTLGAGDLTSPARRAPGQLAAGPVSVATRPARPTGRPRRRPRAAGRAATRRAGGRDAPLGPRTTYRVGGPAGAAGGGRADDDLARVAEAVAATGVAVLVVGRGSNLLVADAGFDGLAVVLGDGLRRARGRRRPPVRGRGRRWPLPGRGPAHRRAAGSPGFEWAVGVPGSVGRRRAHERRRPRLGHGRRPCVGSRVVDLAAGEDARGGRPSDLALGYRHSALRPDQVVVEAELALRPVDGDRGEARPRRDRALAAGQPARRAERRARCSPTRPATPPAGSSTPPGARACARHRRGLDQARQLHPGRRRRLGRRRAGA